MIRSLSDIFTSCQIARRCQAPSECESAYTPPPRRNPRYDNGLRITRICFCGIAGMGKERTRSYERPPRRSYKAFKSRASAIHRHNPNTASANGIRDHTSTAYPSRRVSSQPVPAGHPDQRVLGALDGARCLQQWSDGPTYNLGSVPDPQRPRAGLEDLRLRKSRKPT